MIVRVGRLWHGLLALVIAACLVIQVVLVVTAGGSLLRLASYFTIQSNILVMVSAAVVALSSRADGRLWRVLRLDGLLGIVITGIVYAFVLAATNDPQGWALVTDTGFHYVAPWFALAGWLVFGPRPRIDRRTLLAAVLWPVLWIAWTLIHGAATSWYPYPFTDVSQLGYPAALRNLGLVVLTALALAGLLRWLDTRLPAAGPRPAVTAGVDDPDSTAGSSATGASVPGSSVSGSSTTAIGSAADAASAAGSSTTGASATGSSSAGPDSAAAVDRPQPGADGRQEA